MISNNIDVDLIVCPTFMGRDSMVFRDLNGVEQIVYTEEGWEEFAHLVLTINNNKSYCIPYIIEVDYGFFMRYKPHSQDPYSYPEFNKMHFIKSQSESIKEQEYKKKPWYKKLFSCIYK
jgi:hypothetical protein